MISHSRQLVVGVALLVVGRAAVARAEPQLVFRMGVEPLALEPSSSTPWVGGYVDDAVTAYNAASTSYNRAHGFAAGSAMAVAPIDRSALGLNATLVTLAPGLEVGGEHVKFRIEGLIGVSDHVRAYGLGVYPLDLALPLHDNPLGDTLGPITPYLVAGATVRWLDRSDTDGDVGGLFTARAAIGVHVSRVVVELGVSAYALGGLYNSGELHAMSMYNPKGSAPPPAPDQIASGGTQSGMIDVSVGFSL